MRMNSFVVLPGARGFVKENAPADSEFGNAATATIGNSVRPRKPSATVRSLFGVEHHTVVGFARGGRVGPLDGIARQQAYASHKLTWNTVQRPPRLNECVLCGVQGR